MFAVCSLLHSRATVKMPLSVILQGPGVNRDTGKKMVAVSWNRSKLVVRDIIRGWWLREVKMKTHFVQPLTSMLASSLRFLN